MKAQKIYVITLFIIMFCFSKQALSQASSADPILSTTVVAPNTPSTTPGDFADGLTIDSKQMVKAK